MSPITTSHTELDKLRGNPFGKSPVEQHLANGHFRATRRLVCDWGDRDALLAELGAAGGQLYPHDVGKGARAYAGNAVGWGRSSAGAVVDTVAYTKALVTVYYSTEAPYVTGGWFVSETIRPAREFTTLNTAQGEYRWGGGGGAIITSDIGIPEARLVYGLTFHNCVAVPVAASTYIGSCNASPVSTYTLGLTFATETLYHPAPYISITFPLGGASRYSLSYAWEFTPNGWNTRRNPSTGTYQAVWSVGAGAAVVFAPTVNFGLLRP